MVFLVNQVGAMFFPQRKKKKPGPIPSRVSLNVPVYDCEAVLGANEHGHRTERPMDKVVFDSVISRENVSHRDSSDISHRPLIFQGNPV